MESKKKNGTDEPSGRAGIKTQTYRMDLRTRQRGREKLGRSDRSIDIYTLPNVK